MCRARTGRDLEKSGPRAGGLAQVLEAVGQVELGAQARIDVLAFGELGASVGVVAFDHELASLVEENLRRGLVGGGRIGSRVAAGTKENERERRKPEGTHDEGPRAPFRGT